MTAKETARQIEDLANKCAFASGANQVAKELVKTHPTLQQCFTRLCAEWLKELSHINYVDERNMASLEFAQAVVEKVAKDKFYFPFI